jgi:hypothetical protein
VRSGFSLLFAALIALLPMTGCTGAPYYQIAQIEGWVVEADTNRPIEGAVVAVSWELVMGWLDGPRHQGYLEVKEVVTDKNGRFHFEGFTAPNPTMHELRNDPVIIVFKGGYAHRTLRNAYPKTGIQREAEVNGKTIKLEPIKPSSKWREENDNFYDGPSTDLSYVIKDCEWKKIPRMILALDQEYARIKAFDPRAQTGMVTIERLEGHKQSCGSAKEFFKEYKK